METMRDQARKLIEAKLHEGPTGDLIRFSVVNLGKKTHEVKSLLPAIREHINRLAFDLGTLERAVSAGSSTGTVNPAMKASVRHLWESFDQMEAAEQTIASQVARFEKLLNEDF